MQLSGIKNIIFDLGGVIINLDFNKTYDAFSSLCQLDQIQIAEILKSNSLFDIHGNGDLTDEQFREEVKRIFNTNISDQDINKAFNALLLDIPVKRIELLKKLSKDFRLFLLSNTNNIHINEVNQILSNTCKVSRLDDLFEKVYYSHLLNLSKPDIRIYKKVIEENGLLPEETLFIDDNSDNIKGAEAAGIKGILVGETYTILEIFSNAY